MRSRIVLKCTQCGAPAADSVVICPFCGANAGPGEKSCTFCNAKLVIERMRIARLVISGGSMSIGGGGRLEVVGRQLRAIHRAAAADDLDAVKAEVMDGDDPDFEDNNGKRPLHHAAAGGALAAAQWLLAIGAKPNTRDGSGKTPLQVAEAAGHTSLVDLFSMYATG